MPVATDHYEPGHIKFNPDYTLSLRPDLIVLEIFPNRDMGLGMTRAKYEGAGYHLEYLVDTRRPPGPQRDRGGPRPERKGRSRASSPMAMIRRGGQE